MTYDLKAARLNRGMSIRGLADEIGVHEATVRRLESGEGVHPENAKKVADFLGVRVTDLMGLTIPEQDAA